MHLKYITYSNTTQNKRDGEEMQIVFCGFGSLFCLTWRPDEQSYGCKRQ